MQRVSQLIRVLLCLAFNMSYTSCYSFLCVIQMKWRFWCFVHISTGRLRRKGVAFVFLVELILLHHVLLGRGKLFF